MKEGVFVCVGQVSIIIIILAASVTYNVNALSSKAVPLFERGAGHPHHLQFRYLAICGGTKISGEKEKRKRLN